MIVDNSVRLPMELKDLFWDYDFRHLEWDKDRDLIISRILNQEGLSALKWLRANISNEELREWLLLRSGAGISPQRLRFWKIILNLPHRRVNAWLKSEGRTIWDRRSAH